MDKEIYEEATEVKNLFDEAMLEDNKESRQKKRVGKLKDEEVMDEKINEEATRECV